MQINHENFKDIIEKFKKFVADNDPNGIVSFNDDGWLKDQEGYKKKIPEGARTKLQVSEWDKSWIGTGKILDRISTALDYQPPNDGNNLVDWHQKADFNDIKDGDAKKIKKVESLIFRLYKEINSDDEIFEALIDNDALGGNYDLISYLFFIKDDLLYLPNRPKSFEKAFELLGNEFEFKMSWNCSWENYQGFCNRIAKIRDLLAPEFDENISRIDAHSFCWVIARNPQILKIDISSAQVTGSKFILTDPPGISSEESLKPRGVRKFNPVSKKDREKQDRRNGQIGDAGEIFVLNTEKRILVDSGRPDLADMVRHASKEDGDGLGYDIKSFSPKGKIKFIEVKTTTGNRNTKFIITDSELDFSTQNPDNYYLYRIYDFKQNAKENPIYILQGNMREKLFLHPTEFTALPKKE